METSFLAADLPADGYPRFDEICYGFNSCATRSVGIDLVEVYLLICSCSSLGYLLVIYVC